MPWATPPTTWPSTTIGLMTRPQSCITTIAQDRHLPGLDVDLDLGDVRAVGIGRLVGREVAGVLEARRRPARHREARHADRDSPRSRGSSASRRSRRPWRSRPRARCRPRRTSIICAANCLIFSATCADGEMHRRAGIDRGARGERADAERGRRGVAGDDRDVVGRAAELIGGDLRERGLVRLALRRRAGIDGDLAAGRRRARSRSRRGRARSPRPRCRCRGRYSGPALRACVLARAEAVVVGGLERLLPGRPDSRRCRR